MHSSTVNYREKGNDLSVHEQIKTETKLRGTAHKGLE